MAKFLFIVPPFFGHLSPTLSVGSSLIEAGHEVGWTGLLPLADDIFPSGGKYFYPDSELCAYQADIDRILKLQDQGPNLSVFEAAKLAIEDTQIPFARIMLPGILRVIDAYQPDIVINDCVALAGALAAYQRGIPYATTIPVPPDVMGKFGSKLIEGHITKLVDLQRSVGIQEEWPIVYSPQLCIAFTSRLFAGMENVPDNLQFVGPVEGRPSDIPFDWERLKHSPTPRIYVSIGTLLVDIRRAFFSRLVEAFAEKQVTVIAATSPDTLDAWPSNFIVQGFVPQSAVMQHVDAVICHGGFNTVNDTFLHGLPMLITPIGYDHFHTANLIERAGCGINLKYKRMNTQKLVQAVNELLHNASYKVAAERVRRSFLDAGGNRQAVKLLVDFYEQNAVLKKHGYPHSA